MTRKQKPAIASKKRAPIERKAVKAVAHKKLPPVKEKERAKAAAPKKAEPHHAPIAHAKGADTKVDGKAAHAKGADTKVDGKAAHAKAAPKAPVEKKMLG